MITARSSEWPPLVCLLLERDEVDEKQLQELPKAQAKYPDSLEEALIRFGIVEDIAVAETYAAQFGVSRLEATEEGGILRELRPKEEPVILGKIEDLVDECRVVAGKISDGVCRNRLIAPISSVRKGVLDIACLNPSDLAAIEEVQLRSGCIVRPHVAPLGLLDQLIAALFGERDRVREIASESHKRHSSSDASDEEAEASIREMLVDLDAVVPAGKEGQVVRIVNTLLTAAIEGGASDIHLEPYEDFVRVRYRIDGKLEESTPPPKELLVPTISRLKILAKMDIAEKRVPQDGAIGLKSGADRVDLRVSTVPTIYGEKMVIRILAKNAIPGSMQDLGFSEEQGQMFLEAAQSPNGLVFVTGPTGSGKSTTLYCCLNLINLPTTNLVTVEDPVEYKFAGMNQVNVRANVGLTFAAVLRSFLRQDPDIIMVGEVRDQETAQICMRAALTGHLVLSTLHTNDSLQVINRLVDMGVEAFLLGPALRMLEAQRLARRLCPTCKRPYQVPDPVAERYALQPGTTLYRAGAGGCQECRDTGYKGRVGIYEVVPIGAPLRELIMQRAPLLDMVSVAKKAGVNFLADAAREKLVAGATSLDEVADYIRSSQEGDEGTS